MDVEAPDAMDGADLRPLLDGRAPPRRDHAIGGYSDSFFIRGDDWALHGLNRPGGFRLYDVRNDPAELRNVAAEHPRLVRELHREVVRSLGARLPFYDRFYVRHLVRQVHQQTAHFPDLEALAFPQRLTLRQFDDLFTAPRWGFASRMLRRRRSHRVSAIRFSRS